MFPLSSTPLPRPAARLFACAKVTRDGVFPARESECRRWRPAGVWNSTSKLLFAFGKRELGFNINIFCEFFYRGEIPKGGTQESEGEATAVRSNQTFNMPASVKTPVFTSMVHGKVQPQTSWQGEGSERGESGA